MKKINLLLVLVVIFAGFLCQSCESEVIEGPTAPAVSQYEMVNSGFYGTGKYQLPKEGIIYISSEGVEIFYCENRVENGKKIYEEIFSPRRSIGVKNADWEIGDTVVWVPNNPEQIIKIIGSINILSE